METSYHGYKLKTFWSEFLQTTPDQKRIVFTEGGVRPVAKDEEQAVSKWGGMGLLTYLAHQNDIQVYSPEPDGKYERIELEKRFPREQIEYCYFARTVNQWNKKQDPKPDFEKYISPYLESDKRESGWDDFDFSLEAMRGIHKSLFGIDFNENDRAFFSRVTDPTHLETPINHVIRVSSQIRDMHIVKEIQKFFNEGYSIFIQYGATHAVMQEAFLKDLLT